MCVRQRQQAAMSRLKISQQIVLAPAIDRWELMGIRLESTNLDVSVHISTRAK